MPVWLSWKVPEAFRVSRDHRAYDMPTSTCDQRLQTELPQVMVGVAVGQDAPLIASEFGENWMLRPFRVFVGVLLHSPAYEVLQIPRILRPDSRLTFLQLWRGRNVLRKRQHVDHQEFDGCES